MAFCDQFKKLRKKKNIKQNQLAEMLGVRQYVISSWETGRSEPSIGQICKISEIMQIPTDYLLDRHTVVLTDDNKFTRIEDKCFEEQEQNENALTDYGEEFNKIVEGLSDFEKDKVLDVVKKCVELVKINMLG